MAPECLAVERATDDAEAVDEHELIDPGEGGAHRRAVGRGLVAGVPGDRAGRLVEGDHRVTVDRADLDDQVIVDHDRRGRPAEARDLDAEALAEVDRPELGAILGGECRQPAGAGKQEDPVAVERRRGPRTIAETVREALADRSAPQDRAVGDLQLQGEFTDHLASVGILGGDGLGGVEGVTAHRDRREGGADRLAPQLVRPALGHERTRPVSAETPSRW